MLLTRAARRADGRGSAEVSGNELLGSSALVNTMVEFCFGIKPSVAVPDTEPAGLRRCCVPTKGLAQACQSTWLEISVVWRFYRADGSACPHPVDSVELGQSVHRPPGFGCNIRPCQHFAARPVCWM